MNPLEILQKTPRTNCGKCGYAACLAFAAAVSKAGEDPAKCPFINKNELSKMTPAANNLEEIGREQDLALIRHLKDKIAQLSFADIAPRLGLDYNASEKALSFRYLGQETIVQQEAGIKINGLEPEDPRDQILLYNYIHAAGGRQPAGTWLGLESLPNSISKIKTLARYSEEPIAELFNRLPSPEIMTAATNLDAIEVPESSASIALTFPVLPMLPLQLLFWEAEPEDGFEAKVKILFDQHVMDFLDLESLVFTAERLAEKLQQKEKG